MKLIINIYYPIALVVLTLILCDVISVSSKSTIGIIVVVSVVLVAVVEIYWPALVARMRYKRWYNTLSDHHKNQVDLYRHTSADYTRDTSDDDPSNHYVV